MNVEGLFNELYNYRFQLNLIKDSVGALEGNDIDRKNIKAMITGLINAHDKLILRIRNDEFGH